MNDIKVTYSDALTIIRSGEVITALITVANLQTTAPAPININDLTRKYWVKSEDVSILFQANAYSDNADALSVLLDGSRAMTDSLTIANANAVVKLHSTASGYPRFVCADTAGNERFRMQYNNDGGDQTSFIRLDAVGAVENTLALLADGNVTINATAPDANNHLTRKDYVDTTTVALDGSRAMTGNITMEDSGILLYSTDPTHV